MTRNQAMVIAIEALAEWPTVAARACREDCEHVSCDEHRAIAAQMREAHAVLEAHVPRRSDLDALRAEIAEAVRLIDGFLYENSLIESSLTVAYRAKAARAFIERHKEKTK